jgi:2-phospho-L-lactate guanylyltransferase
VSAQVGNAQVVIAVRGGPDAKSRCRERLGEAEREQLVEAMLGDMLDAMGASRLIGQVHVATPTPSLGRIAARAGASIIDEAGAAGLNGVFDKARRIISAEHPSATVAFMPGDLPLLDAAELDAALERVRDGEVALAAATADGGTGAVLLRAAADFAFAFGPDSFNRHLAAARAAGLAPVILDAPSLGFDVDGPGDLDRLLATGRDRRAVRLLRTIQSLHETAT